MGREGAERPRKVRDERMRAATGRGRLWRRARGTGRRREGGGGARRRAEVFVIVMWLVAQVAGRHCMKPRAARRCTELVTNAQEMSLESVCHNNGRRWWRQLQLHRPLHSSLLLGEGTDHSSGHSQYGPEERMRPQ